MYLQEQHPLKVCLGALELSPNMAPQSGPDDIKKNGDSITTGVSFTINGKVYEVGSDVAPWTRLVDFLREKAQLPGTKVLCREAGCGLCNVVVTVPDQEKPRATKTYSVQSCQALVYACDGWDIETVENLGDRFDGYHPLQTALHGFAGTQCGYCSPGIIMTMYGQMKNGPLTVSQVEKSLDGNLCRCTGYRPILDAFKSLAVDAGEGLKAKLVDIEEAYKGSCKNACANCDKSGKCKTRVGNQSVETSFKMTASGVHWYNPKTIEDVYSAIKELNQYDKFRIVVGNTGAGVFKNDGPYQAYISTHGIPDLYEVSFGEPLSLGANVSLTRCMEAFKDMASTDPGYAHLGEVAKHWQYVANVSVRNAGSWAGNLMMKHLHQGFQSDIFLTLLAADAELTLGSADNGEETFVSLEQFLETDMSRKVILKVTLPPLPPDTKLRTFKITPRAVNAHAYVNACFRMRLNPDDGFRVTEKPVIVLGGINSEFIHASQTESYLADKRLNENETVQEAVRLLGEEVNPDSHYADASPEYRRSLSQSLLFKTIVGFLGDQVSNKVRSAGPNILRPISSGEQSFDMNEDTWPVGEAVPKLESATQISGEARYLDDIPALPGELHAAFVLTTVANAKIKSIDTEEALKLPGVVSWVSKEDIPGQNSYVVLAGAFSPVHSGPDPVFVEDRVNYAGQPVGAIVAENRDTAVRAAKMVIVEYEDVRKPILTIKDAKEAGKSATVMEDCHLGDFAKAYEESPHQLTGELSMGSQFHLAMEPHAARVVPTEDGYDVYCTTQWPTETQATTAAVLNVPVNNINVTVRRLGGGYGSKISRQHVVSAAAAIAARKLKRPVRFVADLNTHMTYAGWREPYHAAYEVGFDDEGKIQALKVDMTTDAGHVANEHSVAFLAGTIQSTYHVPNIVYNGYIVRTDTAANTYCRTPGHVEATATIENIMEHVAHFLKKDPLEIREINMDPAGVPRLMAAPFERNVAAEDIFPLLKQKASLEERTREVEEFNAENKWKKRGLSVIPLWYGFDYYEAFRFGIQVAIYERDGTVAISHGGVEMGQGINTKVAQVAAYTLRIPLEHIVIKATDTMVGANSIVTGGSFGSDLCAHGVKKAAAALRQRLDVVEAKMKEENGKEPTWVELVQKAFASDVDLSERYWTVKNEHPERYDIWGATCLEVEVDVLSGVYMIRRADIIEDCGRSLSPYVDIGQIEGSFVMGLGLFTSELVKFNPETGQKLSNGTWEYKPPTAHDIPVDMRLTLLPNAKSAKGVLGSKATGEPPLCMSYAVVSALRQAIASFRGDNGLTDWFVMDTPVTVEKVHQLCDVRPEQFQLSV